MADYINFEDLQRQRSLIIGLAREVDYKNGKLFDMEHQLEEKDKQLKAYSGEIESINQENEKLKYEVESQKEAFEQKVKEMREHEYVHKLHHEKLLAENEKLKYELESQEKVFEQPIKERREHEYVCNLEHKNVVDANERLKYEVESQKQELEQRVKEMKENEYLHNLKHAGLMEENEKLKHEVESLKKELEQRAKELKGHDCIHNLEHKNLIAENEKLKREMESKTNSFEQRVKNLEEHACIFESESSNSTAEREKLEQKVKDQEYEIQNQMSLIQTLTLKERISNDELQDARKEAITGLQDILNNRTSLGIKIMGEVDQKPFQNFCLQNYSRGDWKQEAAKLCSSWEEYVKDQRWQPFKKITINGNLQETIDENDYLLRRLRDEGDEHVYKAVTDALLELNDYNPSGRYPVPELWNFKKGQRASLRETIGYVIKNWKIHKQFAWAVITKREAGVGLAK
ncbi:hypothetical protein RJ639_017849 [Escallonia herrerae]|uniref:Factor of DNA methylation 1-5/IDN2 domain-containing protein n=1 Tax=Escallonia herrerae TaxID=1293975 RepID=A0AA88VB33_9ASTE|nr:hypothetical protein RJ639_017849 [Escallonia herrerae]